MCAMNATRNFGLAMMRSIWLMASMLLPLVPMSAMHAAQSSESHKAIRVIVKLPADSASVTKLAETLKEFALEGLKIDGIAEFELRAHGDGAEVSATLNKVAELVRHSRRLGIAGAISINLDELPKLVNERLPNSLLVITGRASESPSPFAPQTMQACAKALKLLSKHFADKVSMVTIHVPQLDVPTLSTLKADEGMSYDFWCGDNYARLSFVRYIRSRYLTLSALNKAWGTKHTSWEEIDYPIKRSSEDVVNSPSGVRRHWIDFINWYGFENAQFVSQLLHHMREAFAGAKLCIAVPTTPVPFASWFMTMTARAISADGGAFIRVNANMPLINAAMLLSSCEVYGVDKICDLHPNDAAADWRSNILLDGSGAVGFQAFTSALLQPSSVAISFNNLQALLQMVLDGEFVIPERRHLTDVAVLLPSVSLAIDPSLRVAFARCMMSICDVLPCDLIDEHLACDGAIEDYRALIVPVGSVFSQTLLERILSWVERGGLLLIGSESVWTDIAGSSAIGRRLLTNDAAGRTEILKALPTALSDATQVAHIKSDVLKEAYTSLAKRIGDGIVMWLPIATIGERGFALIASDVALNISGYAPSTRRAISPFRMWRGLTTFATIDGVIALWYGDFIALFNASRSASAISVQTDFGEAKRKLAPYEFSLITVQAK